MNSENSIGKQFLIEISYYKERSLSLVRNNNDYDFQTKKRYDGKFLLPLEVVPSLGDIDLLGCKKEFLVGNIDPLIKLSTLLHYSIGIQRFEYSSRRQFHRPIPSPRCMYASEYYLCTPDDVLLGESGVYRYEVMNHSLERRRAGILWSYLEEALGIGIQGAAFAITVGTDFWRIGNTYGNFAYSLLTLEAGHATGQLMLVGNQLGYEVTEHDCFLDHKIIALFGMNGYVETPLTILLFWERNKVKNNRLPLNVQTSSEIDEIPIDFRNQEEVIQSIPKLVCMAHSSRMVSHKELIIANETYSEKETILNSKQIELLTMQTEWRRNDFIEVIKERSGGNDLLGTMADLIPISYSDLSKLLIAFTQNKNLEWEHARSLVHVFIVANKVENLSEGVYRLLSGKNKLEVVWQGRVQESLQNASTYLPIRVNLLSIPVCIYLAVDYSRAFDIYGNRGYQIVQMKVAQVAQYLELLASGMNWFMRPIKGYQKTEVEQMLLLSHSSLSVAYSLIFGVNRNPYLSLDMGL